MLTHRQLLQISLGAVVLLAGCSHGRSSHSDPGQVVRITESDFRIKAPARLAAGDVRLVVDNKGPDAHELIVVRLSDAGLSLRSDGTTVNEELLEPAIVGILEAGEPDHVRQLDLHLSPGRYELICNMAGHFMGGMNAVVEVQ